MIKLFKKYNIIYIVGFVILTLLFLGAVMLCAVENISVEIPAVFYILVTIIYSIVFCVAAINKHAKIINILNVQCDAVRFINEYYPLAQRKVGRKTDAIVKINLAIGYTKAGDLENAKRVLCSIDNSKIPAGNTRAVYYAAWTDAFLEENDIENAKSTAAIMKNIIDTELKSTKLQEVFLRSYNANIAEINLKCGCYDGIEEVLNEIYLKTEHMVSKVNIKFVLAQLYLAQGRIDDAKYSLRFAAENGGTLAMAVNANQKLTKLSQQNPEGH